MGYVKRNQYSAKEQRLRRLLRQAREKRGVTQAALATMLRKPQSFVSKYESGERILSFAETIDVCKVLRLKPNSLLSQYLLHAS